MRAMALEDGLREELTLPTALHDGHAGHDDSQGGFMFIKREPSFPPEQEQIVTNTIACGITVHRELGPGFRERIYERAFCLELDSQGMKFEQEKKIDVRYKTWLIPGQKIDLIVEGVVLVELKTVPKLKRLHVSQVISYLKTTKLPVGLLMNFNSPLFKDGLKRVVL
jgi:GxxExxY protein